MVRLRPSECAASGAWVEVAARIVVDASVSLKWFLTGAGEANVAAALELFFAIKQGAVAAVQPLHWVAEIAAVLARETPATAQLDVQDLLLLPQFQVLDSAGVWERAIHIASTAKQHVFDTLYHAVALEWPDAVLVTADEKYFRAARKFGAITLLGQQNLISTPP